MSRFTEKIREFDEIQKAKHYNSHPSGVECKDIAKHLGFYLGNAAKYLWRMHEKHDDLLPDLKKAAFYVQEYITDVKAQKLLTVDLPSSSRNTSADARREYNEKVQLLITQETDATAGVFWALVLPQPASIQNLQTALAVIQNRIIFEDKADTEEQPLRVTAADFRNIRGSEDHA